MSQNLPQNPLEKGGMELSSKKKQKQKLACPQARTKKGVIESSIVSSLQIPKGIHKKIIRSITQGHIVSKAQ